MVKQVRHYFCDICDLRQPNKASLIKHMSEDHGEGQSFSEKVAERKLQHNSDPEENLSESCPICDEALRTVTDLVFHAGDLHEFKGKLTQKVFQRFSDFEQWRKKMEEENITTWVKRRVIRNSDDAYYEYLRCHRSLNTTLHTRKSELQSQDTEKEKKRKRKSSIVVQRSCTSFINVKRELATDVTVAEFCLEHFGHEKEPQKLTLPWSVKLEIADMLKQNLSPSEIVRILKEKQRNADSESVCMLKRQYWITNKDVRRVAAHFKIHPHKYVRMEGISPEVLAGTEPDSSEASTTAEFLKEGPCSSSSSIPKAFSERELDPIRGPSAEEVLFKAESDSADSSAVPKKLLKKEPCSAFSVAEVITGRKLGPTASSSRKVLLRIESDPHSVESSSAAEKLFFKEEPISRREPSSEEAKPPNDEGVRVFNLAVAPDGKGFSLVDHSPCVDVRQDDL